MRNFITLLFALLTLTFVMFLPSPPPAAAETFEEQIAKLEAKLPTVTGKEKVDLLNQLALQVRAVSTKKSLEYAQKALELAQKESYKSGESQALNNLCQANISLSDFPKALKFSQQATDAAQQAGDDTQLAISYNNRGIAHAYLNEIDKSLDFFQKSLAIREKIGNIAEISVVLTDIATLHSNFRADYHKALEYLERALELQKKLGEKWAWRTTLGNMGTAYTRLGNYEKALQCFTDALHTTEDVDDKRGTAGFLAHIGNTYAELKKYGPALEALQKSLEIRKELGNKLDIANTLASMGRVFLKQNQHNRALEHFRESLAIKEAIGDKRGGTSVSISIGDVFFQQGHYREAMTYFKKASETARQTNDKMLLSQSLRSRGKTLTQLRDYKNALADLRRGLDIALEAQDKHLTGTFYEALSETYAAKGDFKNAYDAQKHFQDINDSIFNEKSNKQITEMQTRYDTLKKEQKITLLTKNKEIQDLTISEERSARNALIAGLALVLTILALLTWKYLYLFAFWKKHKYIGRFRLMEEIGTGGMGTIYKAHGLRDKKETVAIKVLKPELFENENSRKRFKQEGAIIDKLDHPNIIEIFERGEYKDRLFIAMEYLRGKTLQQLIQETGRIQLNQSLHIMLQTSDALALIHGKDIIHRDLKPSNIMLIERDDDPAFVKILDFGLAKTRHHTKITMTGTLLGTIDYISPEQLSGGQPSAFSDVYSLGVTFYEMVTGTVVFPGETANDVLKQILDSPPISPNRFRPDLPPELNTLILAMLKKEKESRPTIKHVFDTLQNIRYQYKIRC